MIFPKNNYLRSYGSGLDFKVEIDPPITKDASFHQMCLQTAEEIYSQKQGKIFLMYSGGVDSEYILNIFLSLGIDIIPVIIKLNPNYNDHDVKYAFDFCQSKKLNPVVIDFDFEDFIESGKIIDIAQEFKIAAYQLPATFHCLDKINGTIVMGSHGPPHLSLNQKTNAWVVDEIEPLHTVLKYFEKKKLYGCPYFLVNTPEQYLSFLQHPIMRNLAENKFTGKLGNNSIKWLVYNEVSQFNLKMRKKFTGYENIEKSEIFNHPNLKCFDEFKKQWWGVYSEPYNNFINKMLKPT